MAPSTPTGLLVLAMLVGQVTAFARVPKDGVEKGGEVLGSRMSRAGTLGEDLSGAGRAHEVR